MSVLLRGRDGGQDGSIGAGQSGAGPAGITVEATR